jgi:hypothetical protein
MMIFAQKNDFFLLPRLKKWRGELGIACWQQAGNQVCSLFTIFD